MKTSLKAVWALVALFTTATTSASAQDTYYWDDYSIQVTVPKDFKVVKDNGNELEFNGDGMDMYMYVFNQKKLTADDIDEATIEIGKEMKLTEVDEEHQFKSGDFEGYYVEGFKNGKRIMLAGAIDNVSRTNFFVVITFEDNDAEAEKEALTILNSLDHK